MATFHIFGKLPYELRHKIWEHHIPVEAQIRSHTRALASHILALPHDDTFFRRQSGFGHDGEGILKQRREEESPYLALYGCLESRLVALKHVKKELEKDDFLKHWLEKPTFPFHPKLTLDEKAGTLFYICPKITEEYHLDQLVFWEYTPPAIAPTLIGRRQATKLSGHEEEDEWDSDTVYFEQLDDDFVWSDNDNKKEEKGDHAKRGREDEEDKEIVIDGDEGQSPKRQKLSQEAIEDNA